MKALKLIVIIIVLIGLNTFFVWRVTSLFDRSPDTAKACIEKVQVCKDRCEQSSAEANSQRTCLDSCKTVAAECAFSDENKSFMTEQIIWSLLSGFTSIVIIILIYLLIKLGFVSLFNRASRKGES